MNYCLSNMKRAPPSEMSKEVSASAVDSVQHGLFAGIQQMAL